MLSQTATSLVSGQVAKFPFEVRPYVWQRVGFWLVLIALFTGCVLGAYRFAVNNARQREKELERTVTERTAEIQNYANNLEKISQEREELLALPSPTSIYSRRSTTI